MLSTAASVAIGSPARTTMSSRGYPSSKHSRFAEVSVFFTDRRRARASTIWLCSRAAGWCSCEDARASSRYSAAIHAIRYVTPHSSEPQVGT